MKRWNLFFSFPPLDFLPLFLILENWKMMQVWKKGVNKKLNAFNIILFCKWIASLNFQLICLIWPMKAFVKYIYHDKFSFKILFYSVACKSFLSPTLLSKTLKKKKNHLHLRFTTEKFLFFSFILILKFF